jgi:hypothetical protein
MLRRNDVVTALPFQCVALTAGSKIQTDILSGCSGRDYLKIRYKIKRRVGNATRDGRAGRWIPDVAGASDADIVCCALNVLAVYILQAGLCRGCLWQSKQAGGEDT